MDTLVPGTRIRTQLGGYGGVDSTSDTGLATRCCYCCVLRRIDSVVSWLLLLAAIRSLSQMHNRETQE